MTQKRICCLSSVINIFELSAFLEKPFTVFYQIIFLGEKGGFWKTTWLTEWKTACNWLSAILIYFSWGIMNRKEGDSQIVVPHPATCNSVIQLYFPHNTSYYQTLFTFLPHMHRDGTFREGGGVHLLFCHSTTSTYSST